MNRFLAGLLAVSATACSSEPSAPLEDPNRDRHPSFRRTTLAVADAAEGLVTVLDVEFGEVASTLEFPAPVRLGASYSGNLGVALDASGARFFTSGVAVVDHTGSDWEDQEHLHIYKYPPKLLGFALTGAGSSTVSGRDDRLAVFFAGTETAGATAAIFSEQPVIQDESPEVLSVATEHHGGLAVPHEGRALVTVAAGGSAEAVGLFDEAGPLDAIACGGAAGFALVADGVAFGCAEGLLTVRPDGDALIGAIVAPPGARPHRLASHLDRLDVATDDGGALAVYDPGAAQARSLSLPFTPCDFGFEPALGALLVVLGDDGAIHQVDPISGAVRTTIAVASAFSCDETVRPRLALAPQLAFVSLPSEGAVIEVRLSAGAILRRHEFGGVPHEIVVLGIDPRNRNAGACPSCQ